MEYTTGRNYGMGGIPAALGEMDSIKMEEKEEGDDSPVLDAHTFEGEGEAHSLKKGGTAAAMLIGWLVGDIAYRIQKAVSKGGGTGGSGIGSFEDPTSKIKDSVTSKIEELIGGQTEKDYEKELHERSVQDQLEKYVREIEALSRAGLSPSLMYGYGGSVSGAVPTHGSGQGREMVALEIIIAIIQALAGMNPLGSLGKLI